ncbi:MAG: hypothetical protein K2G41_05565 [Duncaniella sp.]|uniref:hypothetical protein n=1 Tax=Duncaniella sp. TaxID=2518496 RepID=UPI0023CAE539|nr:hypothetical protein [Duncaniella sp.]MDE6090151.1 hypothetical protein [Duncaniella sp.]
MARNKYSFFKRGDVIRTNPQEGFYGIAVVLDDGVKLELSPNKWSYPMCHIAITPLIYDFEVTIEDIDIPQLHPLRFQRCYCLKNTPEFFKEELLVHIYTTRNVAQFPVIGNIDPSNIYKGDLSWEPKSDRFFFYGDTQKYLGREAYLNWLNMSSTTNKQ